MSNLFGAPTITPLIQNGQIPGSMPDIPDVPDAPSADALGNPGAASGTATNGGLVDFGGLVESFRTVAPALDSANAAEQAFIAGRGNMLEMVLERAKADTLLSLTSATASKVTQAASTLMNLQV